MEEHKNNKKKYYLFIIFLLSVAVVFSLGWQKIEAPTTDSSVYETNTSESVTEIPEEKVTEKLVQVYVAPELYDTTTVTENDFVPLQEEPSSQSNVLEKIHRGEWTNYLGTEGDWIYIQTNKGNKGYIPKENSKEKEVTRTESKELTVVLDAGHGGSDTGATSSDGVLNEKDLTLKTVQTVGKVLEAAGINVVYTRTKDTYLELTDITQISLEKNADLFLSLHYDNYDYANVMSGFTTYYYYEKMKSFAEIINQELAKQIDLTNNGIRQGNYLVIRESYVPSLLLELGYMNSDQDLAQINTEEYRENVAAAILSGVEKFGQNYFPFGMGE